MFGGVSINRIKLDAFRLIDGIQRFTDLMDESTIEPMLASNNPLGLAVELFSLNNSESGGKPAVSAASTNGLTSGTASGVAEVLYLVESGDTSSISVNDIHQGFIGDCYLLASVGALAWTEPAKIRNIIHDNGNGTETVTLHSSRDGRAPNFSTTTFDTIQITVDNVFPNYGVNGGGQTLFGNQQEIWVQVLEKALATENGGYSSISNGGWPMLVMEELTGKLATKISPAAATTALLASLQHDGNALVFDSLSRNNLPYGIVGDHAYVFEGLTNVNGTACVRLGNPWGYDQPSAVPVSKLSQAFAQIDVCHT